MRRRKKAYFVYITASKTRVLYVGVTNSLYHRIKQHKEKQEPKSFTARYNVNKLVYYETHDRIYDAIAREKQIKRWRRDKKVKLIESVNPKWKDLSQEAFFDEGTRF